MLDPIDKKLLILLQEDGQTPYHQLAKKIKIAPSTVHFRIKRLMAKGIIERFMAIVNPEKIGCPAISYIGINVAPLRMKSIAQQLTQYEEVQIVGTSSGSHDFILKVIMPSERALWMFINTKLRVIEGIEKEIHVSTLLDIYKNTHKIPLTCPDLEPQKP